MSQRDYLLSFGNAGDFGRFRSEMPLPCRRGDKLVVRSARGQELAVVIRPDRELPVQKLMTLMDALQRAQISKVGIATKAETK